MIMINKLISFAVWMMCSRRALIKLMPMGDFFEEQFKFADIFNLLRLNDAEVGLFTGIVILNPGIV